MFLKNHWYVAAWNDEIGRTPLARILLNEYVVLFRKEDGTPVALANRCPHRNLPLSSGRLVGDWCVAADNRRLLPELCDRFAQDMRNVLAEDLAVYEAQQRCIDLDPDAPARDANPLGAIPADEGLLAMRRIIRRLYGEEQKQSRSAA